MPKYRIHIRETVTKIVPVEADTLGKAYADVREKFNNGEIKVEKGDDNFTFSMYCSKTIE